jgi:hypothetical protein
MSLNERIGVCLAVIFLLWRFWPVARRLVCGHPAWRTVETVAGFGVPILDQRCARCGRPRRILAGDPVARRREAR